jgi:hypothetical protein
MVYAGFRLTWRERLRQDCFDLGIVILFYGGVMDSGKLKLAASLIAVLAIAGCSNIQRLQCRDEESQILLGPGPMINNPEDFQSLSDTIPVKDSNIRNFEIVDGDKLHEFIFDDKSNEFCIGKGDCEVNFQDDGIVKAFESSSLLWQWILIDPEAGYYVRQVGLGPLEQSRSTTLYVGSCKKI